MDNIVIKTPNGERVIGPGFPVFIVAELSGNHNQEYERAIKIIDIAAAAGVDAVKLQTYTADTITIDSREECFQINNSKLWQGQTLYDLYEKAYTPWEWQPRLKAYIESKGLVFFSTPFDTTAVDYLEEMNVALYKIASLEVGDIPLLKRVGKTRKPVIMSRGTASIEEIELAIQTLRESGTPQVGVLHCISAYPARAGDMNLLTIPDIHSRFQVVSGLSDHTLSDTMDIAAVALGASIIEKHVTINRADGGPDAAFSLESGELKRMVNSIRETEVALGKPSYAIGASETETVKYRKSLFVVSDMQAGERFTEANVRSIRPGCGLKPVHLQDIIGKKARVDIKKATPLSWELIQD